MRALTKLIFFCLILGSASSLWAAGLGSTYEEFEREWNKGYRKVFQLSEGMKEVHVGFHDRRCLIYEDGFHAFGHRVGKINGNTNGLFSASDKTLPTKAQFFHGVKQLIPSDSKLIAKYRRKSGYVTEIFIFKSSSLAQLKGIEKSLGYQDMKFEKNGIKEFVDRKAVGKFFLITNYDINGSGSPVNFTLVLGSGENDIGGMKNVKAEM